MSRKAAYIPERGDAVWITLDPQASHEQAGRRPGIVLTPLAYHQRSRLAIVCPITSREGPPSVQAWKQLACDSPTPHSTTPW